MLLGAAVLWRSSDDQLERETGGNHADGGIDLAEAAGEPEIEPEAVRPKNRSSAPAARLRRSSRSLPWSPVPRLFAWRPPSLRPPFPLPRPAITECLRDPGNGRREAYPHLPDARYDFMTPSRLLLIVLTLWGLFMIVPDVIRVAQPLGSFGFYADNDGLIYDVAGPFDDRGQVARLAGGHADRRPARSLAPQMQPQRPRDMRLCAGCDRRREYVLPGRQAVIPLVAGHGQPARDVTLVAAQRPSNFVVRAVLLLDQIAGIAVVIAAAWLVWTRPSAMSWGFFLYVNWFNPGQAYAFYAILQQWPLLLLAQDFAGCFAQAVGLCGTDSFRYAGAQRRNRSAMASSRACSALSRPDLRARAGCVLWQCAGLSAPRW